MSVSSLRVAYLQDHGSMDHTSDGTGCTDCGDSMDNIGFVGDIAANDLNYCTRFPDRFNKL